MVQAHVDSAYTVCKERMGDYPRPVQDVTPEQLTTLAVRRPDNVEPVRAKHPAHAGCLGHGIVVRSANGAQDWRNLA